MSHSLRRPAHSPYSKLHPQLKDSAGLGYVKAAQTCVYIYNVCRGPGKGPSPPRAGAFYLKPPHPIYLYFAKPCGEATGFQQPYRSLMKGQWGSWLWPPISAGDILVLPLRCHTRIPLEFRCPTYGQDIQCSTPKCAPGPRTPQPVKSPFT